MKREYQCENCGLQITMEANLKNITKEIPGVAQRRLEFNPPLLCQKCDPAFASLLDNKYHKTVTK